MESENLPVFVGILIGAVVTGVIIFGGLLISVILSKSF